MPSPQLLLMLMTLAVGLAACHPGLAETPEHVQQRLERLRQLDAEASTRRQENVEFQERRKREEYARRWKRYGDEEIDVLRWRQQKDGTWVTEIKKVAIQSSSAQNRFDASLETLVRDGVVNPAERGQIRSDSSMTPSNTPAQQQACNSGALNQQECKSGLVVWWQGRTNQGAGADGSSGFADSMVGVSCTTLMVNRKPTYKPWGSWQRPGRGTPDEQLVIDRCANPNRLSTP